MNEIIIKDPCCIEKIDGFTTLISHLIKMMNYARLVTLSRVKNLSVEQLDFQYSESSNSIGALLAHIAAVEKWYQIFTFEEREMSAEEYEIVKPEMELGELGREKIKGNPIEFYVDKLNSTRDYTITEFQKRNDEWLLAPKPDTTDAKFNKYFDWFHVFEDEINHRGQISIIRKMQSK